MKPNGTAQSSTEGSEARSATLKTTLLSFTDVGKIPGHTRSMAAELFSEMQDAEKWGLSCMPPIEPSIAFLVLSPDEGLKPDACCP